MKRGTMLKRKIIIVFSTMFLFSLVSYMLIAAFGRKESVRDKEEKTVEHKIITVGDTKITIDGENVSIETSGKVSFIIGGTTITEEDGSVKIKTDSCEIKGSDIKVDGGNVTITGGNLKTKGVSSTDLQGPFNAIKVCPFSGAPHCGSSVSGT